MLSERFDQALVFTHQLHRKQIRKGSGLPYIHHLLSVAALTGEHGGTEDQVIGALLHDSIEDCIGEVPDIRAQIEGRFGSEVLRIVEGCTDADVVPKPPWRERKEAYLELLDGKPNDHPSLLVSLADKVHNSRSLLMDYREVEEELWGRFRGGREGTLWYYESLARAFAQKDLGVLADEFTRIVEELQALAAANTPA